MAKPHPTVARLRELLTLHADGRLTWNHPRGVASGRVAGCFRRDGRIALRIDGDAYYAHRVVWIMSRNAQPVGDIDHINGNTTDNRPENLRDVTHSVNIENRRRANKNSASGLIGAHFCKTTARWFSQITVNGKNRRIGFFDSAQDAHAAYVAAKRRAHAGCTL